MTLFVSRVILVCLADQATMAGMSVCYSIVPLVGKVPKALQRHKAGGVGIFEECDRMFSLGYSLLKSLATLNALLL